MLRIALALAAAALALPAVTGGAATPAAWTGSVRVPGGAEPVRLAVVLRGSAAEVTLGPGHPVRARVVLRREGGRLRLSIPGRPPLVLDGKVAGRTFAGVARHGQARGSFSLAPGRGNTDDGKAGLYRRADGAVLGVVALQSGRLLIDYASGEAHALYGAGAAVDHAGAGVGRRDPVAGEVRYDAGGLSWRGAPASRAGVRQLEVRFPSRGATLSGTLTVPAGQGPFPAAVLVHGSGPRTRADQAIWASYLLSRGVATLVYDKRGIGWSGGRYLGEAASAPTIDALARDAEAAARFLAAQPDVDRGRVGLFGISQAGWIMPLAATREPSIRWLVPVVGPTVTQGESDGWGHGIGQGADTSRTFAEVEAEVRSAGPSGVDPLPWIRRLDVPALWLWGGNDRHVPTSLCVERLAPLAAEPGRDLSYVVFERANHFLIDSADGLSTQIDASSTFAPGLFTRLDGWLRAHGLLAA